MSFWQRLIGRSPQEQVEEIKNELHHLGEEELSLKKRLERIYANMGRYKSKDPEILKQLIIDIEIVVKEIEELVDITGNIAGTLELAGPIDRRVKDLKRRLLNNLGRAKRALAA